MSVFGGGRVATAALRGRVLELIGAEPEWAEGDHDGDVICWTSGPATTFLAVGKGPADAPGLGVLRVFTPVATVGDEAAALERSDTLNSSATTSRWVIAPGPCGDADADVLRIDCSFVVGPHNQVALESFVTWCVREQIAAATAAITGGLAEQLGGKPCIPAHANVASREAGDWHEAVRHDERVAGPGKGDTADDLAIHLQRAFLGLREDMLAEGRGAWYSPEPDSYPLSCEMPATWSGYGKDIRWDSGQAGGPLTARVHASLTTWGDLGNGLLITMSVPAARPGDVHQLNRLDEQARDATHFIGAWAPFKGNAVYLIFLPAALLGQDIAWPAVMREILLTFARQAQLARRVVLDPATRQMLDGGAVQPVGCQAPLKPHGLAWGETGEGWNRVDWHLDAIYRLLVGDDGDWAYPAPHGFRWWPYQQAQEISAVQRGGDVPEASEVVRVRVATEVRANVAATPEALTAIAKRNASLPESALVLRDDGTLVLACQFVITVGLSSLANAWIKDLAVSQFVTARELACELPALGDDAASAHPISGPRPEPDWWFGQFAEGKRQAAEAGRDDMPESRPQVALIAAGGQYALPYRMTIRDDGVLEFAWRAEHTPYSVRVTPEIRVTATPSPDEAGPAWIIRSHMPVAGSDADMARWCNERNADLLLSPTPPVDLMMFGGWGLAPGGGCCLTIALARHLVRDDEAEAAQMLGYLLREAEMAAGLDTVRSAFGRLFGDPPGPHVEGEAR